MPLEAFFHVTRKILEGTCFFVCFDSLMEADIDVPALIRIEIGEKRGPGF